MKEGKNLREMYIVQTDPGKNFNFNGIGFFMKKSIYCAVCGSVRNRINKRA